MSFRADEEWVRKYMEKRRREAAGGNPGSNSGIPPVTSVRTGDSPPLAKGGPLTRDGERRARTEKPLQGETAGAEETNVGFFVGPNRPPQNDISVLRDSGRPQAAPTGAKYGNRPTVANGKKFASKHEAKVYEELRLRCLAGEYMGLACQVAFYLPGGIKYIADFVVFPPGGGYTVMDAKSEATRKDKTYRLKRRLMKECLHLDIQEV